MTDATMTDARWQNFDVTVADLDRLEKWMSKPEQNYSISLDEITRRIIQGRLEHGADNQSASALPKEIHEKGVLSWDEQDSWKKGSQVLVVYNNIASIGTIVNITQHEENWKTLTTFHIQISQGRPPVKYAKAENKNQEAIFLTHVRDLIQQQSTQQSHQEDLDGSVNKVMLRFGDVVSSAILVALRSDKRFVEHKSFWYLQASIQAIDPASIQRIQRKFYREQKLKATTAEIGAELQISPVNPLGEIALEQVITNSPVVFARDGENWLVLPPLPPPPEQAVSGHYIYDPSTYQIILKPGDRITNKKTIQILNELGCYDSIVTWAEE
jgi:hypothetical protein